MQNAGRWNRPELLLLLGRWLFSRWCSSLQQYKKVEMEKFRGKSHRGEIYPLFSKVFVEYFVRDRKAANWLQFIVSEKTQAVWSTLKYHNPQRLTSSQIIYATAYAMVEGWRWIVTLKRLNRTVLFQGGGDEREGGWPFHLSHVEGLFSVLRSCDFVIKRGRVLRG